MLMYEDLENIKADQSFSTYIKGCFPWDTWYNKEPK